MFGPIETIFPARARVEYNALVQPFLSRGRGTRGRNDADAIGEEGDAECCAWVQVLADEEVAVV